MQDHMVAQLVKNLLANAEDARDTGLIPGSGRSSGEGNGNLLQYPCLENSMDRGDLPATVHGYTESDMTEWLNSSVIAEQNMWNKFGTSFISF